MLLACFALLLAIMFLLNVCFKNQLKSKGNKQNKIYKTLLHSLTHEERIVFFQSLSNSSNLYCVSVWCLVHSESSVSICYCGMTGDHSSCFWTSSPTPTATLRKGKYKCRVENIHQGKFFFFKPIGGRRKGALGVIITSGPLCCTSFVGPLGRWRLR